MTANPNQLVEEKKEEGKTFGATMQGFKLDEDSSEEDVDAIPAEMKAFRPTRIDKKRKKIVSWRDEKLGFCTAFFQGRMRPNDYVTMWSLIFMSTLIIIYGAASAALTDNSVGIMFAVIVLHVVLLGISLFGNIFANRRFDTWERWLLVGSFVLVYAAGVIFLIVAYDTSLLSKDDDELTADELKEKHDARDFITGELIVVPLITAMIAFCMKAYRDNVNGRAMTAGFWILTGLLLLQGIALTVAVFVYTDSATAWACLFALSFSAYAFIQYIMLVRYSNRPIKISESVKIPPHLQQYMWGIMNFLVACGVFIGTLVYVSQDDDISDFGAATTVAAILMTILLVGVIATWIRDRTRLSEMPIYHSPWIFPIYKYYPADNDVEPYQSAVVGYYTVAFLATIWALVATVEVTPSWLGVALTCGIQIITFIVTLYFTNTNNLQYLAVKNHVDALVIKQAWLDSKENLVKMLQVDTRADYISYERWWRRRRDLRNYMLIWRGKGALSWPESDEFKEDQEALDGLADDALRGRMLRGKLEEWVDNDECNLDSWEDCQKFMYETDRDVKRAYMAELETIIQFQLIIL